MTQEAREEFETRQAEKLAAAQANGDFFQSMRDRRDLTPDVSGWIGRNMRKMRAKRDRSITDEKTFDREGSYDTAPSSSPLSSSVSERSALMESGGFGSGIFSFRSNANVTSATTSETQTSGSYVIDTERSAASTGQANSGVWSMVEEDTAEIRYMPSDKPGGVPKIKAATPDKLVEWLTSHKYSGMLSLLYQHMVTDIHSGIMPPQTPSLGMRSC